MSNKEQTNNNNTVKMVPPKSNTTRMVPKEDLRIKNGATINELPPKQKK